jgi:tetratricopeptide (TPR) repeat protein
MAGFYNTVAATMLQRQDSAGARRYLDKGLAIMERTRGPEHPAVAMMLANLGAVVLERGDTREARQMLERSIEIWEAAEAEHESDIATARLNLGYAAMVEGKDADAEKLFRSSLAVWEREEARHPNVFRALGNLGTTLQKQKRYDEALEVIERALELADETIDPESGDRAYVMTDLGIVLLEKGETEKAAKVLSEALELRLRQPGMPPELPRLRFALARALIDTDPKRALELARTARAGYASMAEEHPMRRRINDVEAWLGKTSVEYERHGKQPL